MKKNTNRLPEVVYISGPVSGRPFWKVWEDFEHAEYMLRARGFKTVNPLYNGVHYSAPHAAHMKEDIKMECGCDAIYYIPHPRRWVSLGVWQERLVSWFIGLRTVRCREVLGIREKERREDG